MTNNRIASDSPRFLFDSDASNRVVGIKQPDGTEEFLAMSPQQPPGVQGAMQSYIASSAVAVSVTNTTVETTLATITIPANAMGPNGWIEVYATFSYTNSANSKILRIRLGGTAVGSSSVTTTAALTGALFIHNRNDVASQLCAPGNLGFSATANASVATTFDSTGPLALTINGLMAALAETITLERFVVRVFKQG